MDIKSNPVLSNTLYSSRENLQLYNTEYYGSSRYGLHFATSVPLETNELLITSNKSLSAPFTPSLAATSFTDVHSLGISSSPHIMSLNETDGNVFHTLAPKSSNSSKDYHVKSETITLEKSSFINPPGFVKASSPVLSTCGKDGVEVERPTETLECVVSNLEFCKKKDECKHEKRKGFTCPICTVSLSHRELEDHFSNHRAHQLSISRDLFVPTNVSHLEGKISVSSQPIVKDSYSEGKISGAKKPVVKYPHSDGKISVMCQPVVKDSHSEGKMLVTSQPRVKCDYCDETFVSKFIYSKHRCNFHSSNNKYSCIVCLKDFNSLPSLEIHLKGVHSVYEDIECIYCKRQLLGPMRLKRHIERTHSEEGEYTDPRKQFLKQLEDTYLLESRNCAQSPRNVSSLSTMFSCLVCNLEFDYEEYSKEHKDGREFFCRVCQTRFENHDDLESHFFCHTFKCRTCWKRFFTKKELCIHRKKSDACKAKLCCKSCGKIYLTKKTLNIHTRGCHSTDKLHECIVCQVKYKYISALNSHMRDTHCAYEYVECVHCNKTFLGPTKLQLHITYVHLYNQKPCVCSVCGKLIKHHDSLTRHMKTHEYQDRLSCEMCGKKFKGKQGMESHMKREHRNIDDFYCKLCDKTYNSELKWRTHFKRNSNHTINKTKTAYCDICGKGYKNRTILKNHQRIHSDEKPFKCGSCGAAFKVQVALKTHMRIHSSVGKYCCSSCGLTFRWKQTFDKHIQKCKTSGNKNIDSPDTDVN